MRSLTAALLAYAAGSLPAQQATPTPTPAPATQNPAPTQAPERPAAGRQDPQPGTTPAPAEGERAGRGGRRRGQGPGGPGGQGDPGAQGEGNLELPEFTPVAAPKLDGLAGKQSFWFTMYPNFLVQYDPATDTVAKKVALQGMFWSTSLTHDRKRMLCVTEGQHTIEVVDLATATVASTHPFTEEGFILRIRDVRECPGGVHWLVRTERVKKEIDRYSFEPAQWLLYDSANKKVVRKVRKLPDALDRGAQLTADGTQWTSTDEDGNLLFLDARTFKELGKIDLKTPRYFGAGAIRLSGNDLLDRRDPTRALMLYTSTDPVETRRTNWGTVELDLTTKEVVSVTDWGPNQNSWGMRIAHKKKVGVSMSGGFGGRGDDDNRMRLVMIDLTTGQKICEATEEFRPRRSLVAISPEGDKVYIGTAGSDFEIFDGNLKRLKTVELDGEIVGRIHTVDG
ncbi:MAG: hypothetical protein JNK15_02905 [Planctomycetes bacterium]|nr:hypothetical protein [Planctomycetota bacterium]